ncbi:hypothetical protein HMPREF1548_01144 [Clostridium sp. KLE 1755]|nr:hypothetical protein HMPREF1548_01144 [Clostridium sp. KLE 1755]
MGPDVSEMGADIVFAENKADITDLLQIFRFEILFKIKGDIAAFNYQVLFVLNGSFDHLPHNRPQIIRQQPAIAFRRQGCAAAADQAHFQVIDGQIRIGIDFQKFLGKKGLSGVSAPGNQYNHKTPPYMEPIFIVVPAFL